MRDGSALCTLLIKMFEDARPVVRWLNKQQKVGGGYGSTQVPPPPRYSIANNQHSTWLK